MLKVIPFRFGVPSALNVSFAAVLPDWGVPEDWDAELHALSASSAARNPIPAIFIFTISPFRWLKGALA